MAPAAADGAAADADSPAHATTPRHTEQERYLNELNQSREEREARKQRAKEACEPQHIALMECFVHKTFFQSCAEQQQAFWDCYRRERGRKCRNPMEVRLGVGPETQGFLKTRWQDWFRK